MNLLHCSQNYSQKIVHRYNCVVLLSLVIWQAGAIAQVHEHLNEQQLKITPYLPAAPKKEFQLPPVPTYSNVTPAADGNRILVQKIQFLGNTVFTHEQLEELCRPYLDRQLDAADLEELRQIVSRFFVNKGYINSGAKFSLLPYKNHTLFLDIIEGSLTEINLRGEERLDPKYITQKLNPPKEKVFSVNALRERFQMLLEDPLIERLNAKILPGKQLGEAQLDLDVMRAKAYHLNTYINNYRPPSVGSIAIGSTGSISNLMGRGDVLDMGAHDTTANGNGGRYSLGYRMPINYTGTWGSIRLEHGASSVVEEPASSLGINSTLDIRELGLAHTLMEDLRQKFTIGINHVDKKSTSRLLSVPFSFIQGIDDGVTRTESWHIWQEYGYRVEKEALALRSNFITVRNNLQYMVGMPSTYVQAPNNYRLWLGQAQYIRKLNENGAQLSLRGNLQITNDMLISMDRMAIGGAATVRGYRENSILRDEGLIANVEVRYPLIKNAPTEFNFTLIPFWDWGQGKNQGEGRTTLASMGLGAQLKWSGATLDIALASRTLRNDAVRATGSDLQDHGIHFQLSINVL